MRQQVFLLPSTKDWPGLRLSPTVGSQDQLVLSVEVADQYRHLSVEEAKKLRDWLCKFIAIQE